MAKAGGLEGGVIFIKSDKQIEVGQGGVIHPDQIDLTQTEIIIGSAGLGNQ